MACSPAVESVPVSAHVAGSAVPSFQTLARSVVGDVPVTWRRAFTNSPAPHDRPGTVVRFWTTVSVPPTTRTSCAVTAPPAWARSLSR